MPLRLGAPPQTTHARKRRKGAGERETHSPFLPCQRTHACPPAPQRPRARPPAAFPSPASHRWNICRSTTGTHQRRRRRRPSPSRDFSVALIRIDNQF